jgi:hypothetical protein
MNLDQSVSTPYSYTWFDSYKDHERWKASSRLNGRNLHLQGFRVLGNLLDKRIINVPTPLLESCLLV